MLRAAAPVDALPVMEQERTEFVRLLESLTAEDSSTPTMCDGWTVGDVAVHLLGGDLSFLARNRDRKESELGDRTDCWDDLVSGLDALNQRWVSAGRFLEHAAHRRASRDHRTAGVGVPQTGGFESCRRDRVLGGARPGPLVARCGTGVHRTMGAPSADSRPRSLVRG